MWQQDFLAGARLHLKYPEFELVSADPRLNPILVRNSLLHSHEGVDNLPSSILTQGLEMLETDIKCRLNSTHFKFPEELLTQTAQYLEKLSERKSSLNSAITGFVKTDEIDGPLLGELASHDSFFDLLNNERDPVHPDVEDLDHFTFTDSLQDEHQDVIITGDFHTANLLEHYLKLGFTISRQWKFDKVMGDRHYKLTGEDKKMVIKNLKAILQ